LGRLISDGLLHLANMPRPGWAAMPALVKLTHYPIGSGSIKINL
jgi:hypothetical protein